VKTPHPKHKRTSFRRTHWHMFRKRWTLFTAT